MPAFRFEFHQSAAETVAGTSPAAGIEVPSLSMLMVGLDVTSAGGTASPTLYVWLQGSDDGGATWYDVPVDQRMPSSASGAEPGVDINSRNITDGATTNGGVDSSEVPVQVVGIYKQLPTDLIRLAWAITGTTPTFTFSASGVGK